MNRTPWRRHEEPLDPAELARLLPAPGDPDLPDDRRRILEEHLMREIDPAATTAPVSPVRRLRRRLLIAVPVTACALAGVLLTGVLNGSDGGGRQEEISMAPGTAEQVAATMDRISDVAARKKIPVPRDDQYVYIKSTVAYAEGSSDENGDPKARVARPHTREDWFSPDGKQAWYIEQGVNAPKGETLSDAKFRPGLNSPSYNYLKTLPTDPKALLKKIYDERQGGNSDDEQAFVTIGDLLRKQLVSPELSAALYRAAAMIPGVGLVEKARDAEGREGLAVAMTSDNGLERTEWIFDRKTYEPLGERTVLLEDRFGLKAGTVTGQSSRGKAVVVDELRERPGDDDRK
ncbi:CU044_5270 family protein [Streptomyces yaizuensis]|uniref:CU044_5270 family protein n=1 Tax=Streptomyces yaizuensis TaxID=2989713 RepID=A0ABQ5P2J3_9ACTN|nr:CU044_5270 family protein [Streptomyces sp. YSPA8]GLF96695.1 CU044_5270 family protein [Streptomyces sp. YSPA8]